jgi:hypothetical protein
MRSRHHLSDQRHTGVDVEHVDEVSSSPDASWLDEIISLAMRFCIAIPSDTWNSSEREGDIQYRLNPSVEEGKYSEVLLDPS